eukprot:TRINITY_DN13946_c0_g1_i1.p1 TRINITY_DN13946_c0_g1~~TRINITY_DN13946_c0_g1_i1.p1  ORF type:complete len:261 (+),score=19.96 TRINITY_DN13946_c0_g1_i1:72-785(+)
MDSLRDELMMYRPGSTLTPDERSSIKHLPDKLVVSIIGFVGHGKSSFVETCEYIGNEKKVAPTSKTGVIGKIYIQDTEGLNGIDQLAIKDINYESNPAYFRQVVQWMKEKTKIEQDPGVLNLIVILWKANVPIPKGSDREQELKNLIDIVVKITKVQRPQVILTHRDNMKLSELFAVETSIHALGGKATPIANYTPRSNELNAVTTRTVMTLLSSFCEQADRSLLERTKTGSECLIQ